MMDNENLIPFLHPTDSRYFDLMIHPYHMMTAEYYMSIMEFQTSLLPKMYRDNPEVWHIYNLDDYQQMAAGYIQYKAMEKSNV